MVSDTRIMDWGLADRVEWLIESGMKSDKAIAAKLNEDPQVHISIKGAKVLPHDVRCYMQHRIKQQVDAQAKAIQRSPETHIILDQARAAIGRVLEMVPLFEELVPGIVRDLEGQQMRWRNAQDAGGDDAKYVTYYGEQVKALKDVVSILDTIISRAESPGIQAIVKANTVNQNIKQGMDVGEVIATVKRMAPLLRCSHCGKREFSDRDLLGVWGKANAATALGDDVIDAEPL